MNAEFSYDEGGWLPPAWSEAVNASDEPEQMLAADHIRWGLDYIRDRYGDDE